MISEHVISTCLLLFFLYGVEESFQNRIESVPLQNLQPSKISSRVPLRRLARSPKERIRKDVIQLEGGGGGGGGGGGDEYSRGNKHSAYFEKLLLPKGYSKLEIPLEDNGGPILIQIAIFIRSLLDINEKEEEITLDADFRVGWTDWNMIAHLNNVSWKNLDNGQSITNFTLDSEFLREIWKPDIFIDEMASSDRTSILSTPVTLSFVRGDSTGDEVNYQAGMVYSARTTLKLRCGMSFEYYPADTQTCQYFIRSYSYKVEQLKLLWDDDGGRGVFLNDPSNPNFDVQIESYEPHKDVEKLYIQEDFDNYRRGYYSALSFTIKTRRKLSYHLVQTYLPSVLLIAITWLCFLLPTSMVEARIGISMTTVLTLTAMFAAVREQSPAVSYTMAIDIWMVFCILVSLAKFEWRKELQRSIFTTKFAKLTNIFQVVFIALLLFTFIYWMKLQLKRKEDPTEQNMSKTTYHKIVDGTKRYAFWVFAIIFLVFLAVYWIWLLSSATYFDWEPSSEFNGAYEEDQEGAFNFYRHRTVHKIKTEEDLKLLEEVEPTLASVDIEI